MTRCHVLVCEHLDGTISLHYGPHRLGHYDCQGQLLPMSYLKTGQAAGPPALRSSPINDPGAKSFRAAGLRVTQERKKDQKRKKGAACGNVQNPAGFCTFPQAAPFFLFWSFFLSRSEEHTSELQSRSDLVCRLLLEKKKYM